MDDTSGRHVEVRRREAMQSVHKLDCSFPPFLSLQMTSARDYASE